MDQIPEKSLNKRVQQVIESSASNQAEILHSFGNQWIKEHQKDINPRIPHWPNLFVIFLHFRTNCSMLDDDSEVEKEKSRCRDLSLFIGAKIQETLKLKGSHALLFDPRDGLCFPTKENANFPLCYTPLAKELLGFEQLNSSCAVSHYKWQDYFYPAIMLTSADYKDCNSALMEFEITQTTLVA